MSFSHNKKDGSKGRAGQGDEGETKKLPERIIEGVVAFILSLVNYWKEALVVAVGSAVLTFLGEILDGVKKYYALHVNAIHDPEEVLKYAKLTPIGHKFTAVRSYYDVESGLQFLAIIYPGTYGYSYVQAYQITENAAIPVGKAIPVIGLVDLHEPPVAGQVLIKQEAQGFFKFIDSMLFKSGADEFNDVFGFSNVDGDGGVELFSAWLDESTGGVEVKIYAAKLDGSAVFQVRDWVRVGGEALTPQFSSNILSDKVKGWLLAKKKEVLGEESGSLGGYARKWFEVNGRNKTTGIINMVQIPVGVISQQEFDTSGCSIVVDGNKWFVPFKGPILKVDASSGAVMLAYMPDPFNFREPLGIIEGKEFLWFAVDLTAGEESAVLAMRKSDEYFIRVPLKFEADLDVAEAIEMAGPDEGSDEELSVFDADMPPKPEGKDGTWQFFKFESGRILTDLGSYVIPASPSKVESGNIEIDFKNEFNTPKHCADNSE